MSADPQGKKREERKRHRNDVGGDLTIRPQMCLRTFGFICADSMNMFAARSAHIP